MGELKGFSFPELAWTGCDWALPLKERIRDRLEKLKKTKPAYPDGLTSREVEILQHVSRGKTNQEIADSLHISEKTVANHITNIFSKTGTGNRTEAAGYATRQGLTTGE